MAELTVIREESNDEKIAAISKDVGVPEIYIRALCAGRKLTTTALRIATYEDCKSVFVALKDTRFATFVGKILTDFVGLLDNVRRQEIISLLRQSDSVPRKPEKTSVNRNCLALADDNETSLQNAAYEVAMANKEDAWALKQALTNSVKYSVEYEEVLVALIDLRKIKRSK